MSADQKSEAVLLVPEALRWKEPSPVPEGSEAQTAHDTRAAAWALGFLDAIDLPLGGTITPRMPAPPPPPPPPTPTPEKEAAVTAVTERRAAEADRASRRQRAIDINMVGRIGDHAADLAKQAGKAARDAMRAAGVAVPKKEKKKR